MSEHYQRFSQRVGLREIRPALQVETISEELRNSLWNLLSEFYWSHIKTDPVWSLQYAREELTRLVKLIWLDFFKVPLDTMGRWSESRNKIKKFFLSASWDQVYDFVEFVVVHADRDFDNDTFIAACNEVFDREASAYRFVNRQISPVFGKEEIVEIERAAIAVPTAAADHICRALELLSDRKKPDYLNSIKESISAVEAAARSVVGSEKATLGEALALLERKHGLHGALRNGLSSLYGYSSDEGGIRHALTESGTTGLLEARLMLVLCSAFTNYLSQKLSP